MRILFLIALLFSFTVGGFVDMAHATTADHAHAQHQMKHDSDKPCHSDEEKNQCDDCCCVHSHSMASFVAPIQTLRFSKKQNIVISLDTHYSIDLSRLNPPPRS